MAQIALATAAAAATYYFSGGNLYATAFAFNAAYAAGGYLFPEKGNVPHPDEIRYHPPGYGNFRPYIWGTMRVAGIPVDGPPKLTAHEGSSGGKGGPSEPTPTTYSIDFLREFFCVSRGTHGILAFWFNKRLVGDYRPGAVSGELPVTIYNGASDQLPDPTEEAFYGVGNVTAYRNRLTCVFAGLGLADVGNMPPNVEALVINGLAHIDQPMTTVTVNNNPSGHQWPVANVTDYHWTTPSPAIVEWPEDGTSPVLIVERWAGGPSYAWGEYTYDDVTLAYIGSQTATGEGVIWPEPINNSDGDGAYAGAGIYSIADVRTPLWSVGPNFTFTIAGTDPTGGTNAGPPISTTRPGQTSGPHNFNGTNLLITSGIDTTEVYMGCILSQDAKMLLVMTVTGAQYTAGNHTQPTKWYKIFNSAVTDSGPVASGVGRIQGSTCFGSGVNDTAAMFEDDYTHCWLAFGSNPVFMVYWIDPADSTFKRATIHNTTTVSGNLGFPSEGGNGWSAIYALASGCKAGFVHGKSLWLVERCTTTSGQQRLSEVVADIHTLEGDPPERYDVTELIDIVRGFGIMQQMPGRAAIEALAPIFAFGFREHYDGTGMVVQYVKRGKPSLGAFLDDDLCAHDENGSDIPSPLQIIKGVDTEIPCAIFLKFIDPAMDYQMNVVTWRRQDTASTLVTTMECSVVLTREEAQRVVNMLGQNAINEADKYIWYSTRKYIQYEPEDVVTVKGYDLRIGTKHDNMASGVLKWEGVRSHPGVIVQTGAGAGGSETFEPQTIPEPQETELVIGDWPWIKDESRQRVVQVAMQGALRRSWKGAQLNKSSDGGATYDDVLTDNAPATIGECLTVLPNFGGGKVFDESSRLSVLIHPGGGTLSSATRRAVLSGANYAMVGAEMIQFKNAELTDTNTYTLSGLLRGRHGTEWAMRGHRGGEDSPPIGGDIFCLLPTPLTLDALPIDYGYTRLYKAVTLGRTLATADAYPFRSNGVSLAPYSPVQLGAGFVGDPGSADIAMRWRRRTRLGRGWVNARAPTGQDSMPLAEATEAYRVRIWADGTFQTVVRTETVMDARTFTYTAAMQVADFGDELLTLPAWSVAQIGELGPGYEEFSNGLGAALPLFIPTDTDGYVPPNPLPADGILTLLDWATFPRVYSGSMGQNDRWSVQTTTGSNDSTVLVHLRAAEYNSSPSPRTWALSTVRGDLTGTFASAYSRGHGGNPDAGFTVGGHSIAGYPQIPHNTTIYLNIANEPNGITEFGMFCDLVGRPA